MERTRRRPGVPDARRAGGLPVRRRTVPSTRLSPSRKGGGSGSVIAMPPSGGEDEQQDDADPMLGHQVMVMERISVRLFDRLPGRRWWKQVGGDPGLVLYRLSYASRRRDSNPHHPLIRRTDQPVGFHRRCSREQGVIARSTALYPIELPPDSVGWTGLEPATSGTQSRTDDRRLSGLKMPAASE